MATRKAQGHHRSHPSETLGSSGRRRQAVLFLASDKAAFITSKILDVNGGFIMD
jgi:NAD(P)-dependent dehydrogenase (short-subunit alcohol dehydrogenase family)